MLFRKPGRVLIQATLVIVISACSTVMRSPESTPPFDDTSLSSPSDPNFTPIGIFFHTNDTYRVGPVEDLRLGGFGRIATLLREAKAQEVPVSLLHGGDFLYPSLESQYWHGLQVVAALNFLNEIAPVVVVPGNHEFEQDTDQAFVDAVNASEFQWVVSNMEFNTSDHDVDSRVQDATTSLIMGPKKIGIFGLTLHFEDGGEDRSYAKVYKPYADYAETAIGHLENQGADIIVALTHLDRPVDDQIAALRENHPKLMWVAGGHEHSWQEGDFTDDLALVTKGDSNARSVWKVTVGTHLDGSIGLRAERIVLNEAVERDPLFQSTVFDHYTAALDQELPFLREPIGKTMFTLDGREETVRQHESNWGSYIADVMRGAFPDEPAQFAVLNGGAMRLDDQIRDNITFEDVFRTFGFPTPVRNISISGKNFKEKVLSHGLSARKPSPGRYLQISGFRLCYVQNGAAGGDLVKAEHHDGSEWTAIKDDEAYVVAVPDYLYGGGDNYAFEGDVLSATPAGADLKWMVVADLLKRQRDGEPVDSVVDATNKRIDAVDSADQCFH